MLCFLMAFTIQTYWESKKSFHIFYLIQQRKYSRTSDSNSIYIKNMACFLHYLSIVAFLENMFRRKIAHYILDTPYLITGWGKTAVGAVGPLLVPPPLAVILRLTLQRRRFRHAGFRGFINRFCGLWLGQGGGEGLAGRRVDVVHNRLHRRNRL